MSKEYQLSERDCQRIAEEGLEIDQIFDFDWPTEEEIIQALTIGFSPIDIIISLNTKDQIADALVQLAPLKDDQFSIWSPEDYTEAQVHFIEIITMRLSGNKYMGRNFSREKANLLLAESTKTPWNSNNFGVIFDSLMNMIYGSEQE